MSIRKENIGFILPIVALINENFNLNLIKDLPMVEDSYNLEMKKLRNFCAWASKTRFQDASTALKS
jgi:hypothetical protein